jgi:hypothetical protein
MVEEADAEGQESSNQESEAAEKDATATPDEGLSLRLRNLVQSNAHRLARRIGRKGALGPNEIDLIAQSFGLTPSVVAVWAANFETPSDEQALARALVQLGMHE